MRYFLRDGAEAIRIRAGRSETAACGRQVFTDPKTGDLVGLAWSGIRFLTRMSCWPSAVIRKIPMKLRPRLFSWMGPSTRGGASWIWWNFCLSSRRVVRESRFSSTMACLRSRQVIVQALP